MRVKHFFMLQLFLANAVICQPPGFLDSGEFQVNTYTTEQQRRPVVSHAPDGSFVVVWSSRIQDGGGGDSVQAQRFDSNGDPPRCPSLRMALNPATHRRGPNKTPLSVVRPRWRLLRPLKVAGVAQLGSMAVVGDGEESYFG